MRNLYRISLFLASGLLLLLSVHSAHAQIPACAPPLNVVVAAAPANQNCVAAIAPVNLTATPAAAANCNTYVVSSIPHAPRTPVAPINIIGANAGGTGNVSAMIVLPFQFNYYCNNFTQVHVSPSGWISFTAPAGTFWQPQNYPNATTPNNVIAPMWQTQQTCPAGNIRWEVFGVTPNRIAVFYFNDMNASGSCGWNPQINGNEPNNNYQVHLYETLNKIEFHMTRVVQDGWNGWGATEGIENAAGSAGTAVAGRNVNGGSFWDATNEGWCFMPQNLITYAWSNTVSPFTAVTQNAMDPAPPAGASTYRLVATSPCPGCTTSFNLPYTATVQPAQPTTNVNTSPVCEAQTGAAYSVNIAPPAGVTYLWAVPAGATIAGGQGTQAITVDWGTVAPGAQTVTMTPTAANGCPLNPVTFNVTVIFRPAQPNITAQVNPACDGSVGNVYTVNNTAGVTYTWNFTGLPPTATATPAANSATIDFALVSSGGPYIFTVTPNNTLLGSCTGPARSFSVPVTGLPTQPVISLQSPVVCEGAVGVIYRVTNVVGITYVWDATGLPGAAVTTPNGNQISIDWPVGTAGGPYTLTVTPMVGLCAGAPRNFTINVNPQPTITITATPSLTRCTADPATQFTFGGTSTEVDMSPTVGLNCGGCTAIPIGNTVNAIPPVAGTQTYTFIGRIAATGCTITTTRDLISLQTPATPVVATNTSPVCPGQAAANYSVSPVVGMTYTWVVASGVIASGQGTASIVVNWNAGLVPPGPVPVTVMATAANGCISSVLTMNVVVYDPAPAAPGAIVPTPAGTICRGAVVNYTTPLDPTADTYTWTGLPAGAFIQSGTGTNSIDVNWGTAAAGNYTLNVTASNECGTSAATQIGVTIIDVRPMPGAITRPAFVCEGSAGNFTVINDALATGYTWNVTCSGWTGASVTNAITLTPDANPGPCLISVTAENQCGSSAARTLFVTPELIPSQPSPISGPVQLCPTGLGDYSVTSVNNVNYTWTVAPAGPGLTQVGATSQIDWNGVAPGVYTVTATPANRCAIAGPTRTLQVTILDVPAQPANLTGPTPLCAGQTGNYSVTNVNGVSYAWTVTPAGPTIVGAGNTATVTFPAAGAFNITVTPSNVCGVGTPATMVVNVTAIPVINMTRNHTVCGPTLNLGTAANPSVAGGTWACVFCPGGAVVNDPVTGDLGGLDQISGQSYVFSYTVTTAPCAPVTEFAVVTYGVATPGTLAADATVCSGLGRGTLTLTGYSGTIVRWEKSIDGGVTWTPIVNTAPTHQYVGLTQGTQYRVVLNRTGGCPVVMSNVVNISVVANATAGTSTPFQAVCSPTATVRGTVPAGFAGTSAWTFVSGPGGAAATITDVGFDGSITNMNAPGDYVFRFTLTNAPCPNSFIDATVRRETPPITADAGVDQTICSSSGFVLGNDPESGVGTWSFVSGPGPVPTVQTTNRTGIITGMTAPGAYIFRWTINAGNSCPVSTDNVTVNVLSPLPVVNAGLDQTICAATVNLQAAPAAVPVGATGQWEFFGGPIGTITLTNLPNGAGLVNGMTQPGQYIFQYRLRNGTCPDQLDAVIITVQQPPSPALVPVTQYLICDVTSTVIFATAPAIGVGTWSYVSGPGPVPTIVTNFNSGIINGMTAVGDYVFQWTVNNPPCAGGSSQLVTVRRGTSVSPPATASPNQSVCLGVYPVTVTGSLPPANTGGMWHYLSGPVANTTITTTGVTGDITNLDQPGQYMFEWRVTNNNGTCPQSSAVVVITVVSPPSMANAGPDQTICGTQATVTGNTPAVGVGTWSILAGPGGNLTQVGVSATVRNMTPGVYTLRYTITNAPCPATMDDVDITISAPPVGGTVSSDATVCTGANGGTLTLSGQSGTVLRWEMSTNNFATKTDIANVTTSQLYSNLLVTTQYRAVLSSTGCPNATSGFATITVSQQPTVANAGVDQAFCGPQTVVTLAGNQATVGVATWMQLAGPPVTLTQAGRFAILQNLMTAGTYVFQYEITNAPCPSSLDLVQVTITSPTIGGFITTSNGPAVCTGANGGTLTLNSQLGGVLRWEMSTNNFGSVTQLANMTTTQGFLNLTQTTWYRAVVQNGVCPAEFSTPITITVDALPSAANAGIDQAFCGLVSSTILTGNTPVVGTGTWTQVSGPPSVITQNGTLAAVTQMTNEGIYMYRWTIANGTCPPTMDDVSVQINHATVVGNLASDATVCSGVNAGTLTLTGYTGTITKWESSNNNFLPGSIVVESMINTPNLSYSNLTATRQYRAAVKNGVCPELYANVVTITVVQQAAPALALSSQTICTNTVTLQGSNPSPGMGMWTQISGAPATITPNNLPLTLISGLATPGPYVFRWTVSNAPCASTQSDVTITRDVDNVVANAGLDQTICTPSVTLTGNNPGLGVGTWTSSCIPAGAPAPTMTQTGLQATITGLTIPGQYCFKYTVTKPPCAPTEDEVIVTLQQPALAANAGPDQTLCTPTGILQGSAPTPGTGMWTQVSGPASTITPNNMATALVTGMTAPGVYIYQWTVSNPPCLPTSDQVFITRLPDPVVADAGLDRSLCANNVTLTGNSPGTGAGAWTQVSGPVAVISQSGQNLNVSGMTVGGDYIFRYTITNAPCAPNFDEVIVTRVLPPSQAAVAQSTVRVCNQDFAQVQALVPASGSGMWSFVSGPSFASVSGSNPTATVTGMINPGTYTVRWTVTSAPCAGSTTADVTVIRDTDLATPPFAGANQTLCNVPFAVLQGSAPGAGATGTWRYVNGPSALTNVFTLGVFGSVTNMDLPGVYTFGWRVTQTGSSCAGLEDLVTVTVVNPPTPAVAGPVQSVCGANFNLTGNIPVVGTGMWTYVAGPVQPTWNALNEALTVTNIPQSGVYVFRWTISNPPCTASSFDVPVTVNLGTSGGLISGGTTVCGGTNSGTLTLSGQSGTVVRWERSIDGFGSFNIIGNTTVNQPYTNLTTTTCYRAVVQAGACGEATSNIACVDVIPASGAANAGPNQNICGTTAVLTGNTPASGVGTWSFVTGPAAAVLTQAGVQANVSGLTTAGTYCFQWSIDNSPCGTSNSLTCLTVQAASVGGAVSGGTTVCGGTNSGILSLAGQTGTVVRWERSIDGGATFTPLINNGTSLPFTNLTQTTWFRAVVQNGTCAVANSSAAQVTVAQPSVATAGPATQTVCSNVATVNGTVPPSGTGNWTYITGPAGATPNVATDALTGLGSITNLSVSGTYRFRWTLTNPPCGSSFAEVLVTVNSIASPGTVSGGPSPVCAGANIGTLVLSGASGSVARWESSTDNFVTNTTVHINPTTQHTFVNITQTRWYRAITGGNGCPEVASNSVMITVVPATVAANAGPPQTVCGTFVTLQGNNPGAGVGVWSFAGGPVIPTVVTNGTLGLVTGMTATGTYLFRWHIDNLPCEPSESVVSVTVQPAIAGGAISGPMSPVCAGGNSGVLTLSGQGGTILGWESSTDNFTSIVPIPNGSTQQPFTNLMMTTSFRARVQSGACAPVYSAPFTVQVDQPSVGGMVNGGLTVCQGSNTGLLTLSGQTGQVLRWEWSTDNFISSINTIANTGLTQGFTNLTMTTQFRAIVKNGSCGAMNSTPTQVTTAGPSLGGMVSGPASVCTGANNFTLTATGFGCNVVRWERSTDGWATVTTINVAAPALNVTNQTVVTSYRAVSQCAPCGLATSLDVTVTIDQPTVAGMVSGGATVCSGSNGTLTLSGQTGQVVRWEQSVNNGVTFTTIPGQTGVTLNYSNLMTTTQYRAVVQNGGCASAMTPAVTVTVDAASVGGTVGPNATVCSGGNAGTLTLSGQNGTVIRWEQSVDGGVTFTSINNQMMTFSYVNLTQTTMFRAVVGNGVCPAANSASATVTVDAASIPGTISGAAGSCGGAANGTLTLSGQTGQVLRWEQSVNNGPFTGIVNTTTTLVYSNVVQTTQYRAVVQNGGACASAASAAVTVSVTPPSVGGTLSPAQTQVCGGVNNGTLTLSGQVGAIVRWEMSVNGGSFTTINNTTATQTYTNVTQPTQYRVVVQNGICPPALSSVATVNALPPLSVTGAGVTGCSGLSSLVATATGGSGSGYTYSLVPAVQPPNGTGEFVNLSPNTYTVNVVDGNGCTAGTVVFVSGSPTAPVISRVFNITQTSAVVQWSIVPPGTGVTYQFRYRVIGSQTWTVQDNLTSTVVFLTSLQSATTYEIELAYRCPGDQTLSAFSTLLVHEFTTLPVGTGSCAGANPPSVPVPAPGGVFIDQITAFNALVHWNLVPGSMGYIISWGLDNVNPGTWPQEVVCDPQNTFLLTGLSPGSNYRVRIRTNCSNCTTALNLNDLRSNWTTQFPFATAAFKEGVADVTATSPLTVYPNPNRGTFTVRLTSETTATAEVVLTDVTGRVVLRRSAGLSVGANEIPMELNGYASGLYLLQVTNDGTTRTVKVIVGE